MSSGKVGRFEPYKQALKALSARSGAPLPALFTSFIILHEASAVLPLFGLFYVSRGLGVGETFVSAITPKEDSSQDNWVQEKGRAWVQQGESWAQRVGVRYGVFGFEKGMSKEAAQAHLQSNLAGDVANAVAAYAATKALLPARIALSLYLSPAFSRGIIMPVQRLTSGLFKGKG